MAVASCGGVVVEPERLPLDMYFLVDSSGSMAEPTRGGANKWDLVTDALVDFLSSPETSQINAGIGYFPLGASPTCVAGDPGCLCIPFINLCLANLGGSCTVEDYATISAFSGVHQYCRVGQHAFIGGFSVITKDALPYAKTVGNRARIYGLNKIGLVRRKFSPDAISKLRRAYRYLLMSKLNTSRALAQIEHDATLTSLEVRYLVDFIRTSQRGVILRRPIRRFSAEEAAAEE